MEDDNVMEFFKVVHVGSYIFIVGVDDDTDDAEDDTDDIDIVGQKNLKNSIEA